MTSFGCVALTLLVGSFFYLIVFNELLILA